MEGMVTVVILLLIGVVIGAALGWVAFVKVSKLQSRVGQIENQLKQKFEARASTSPLRQSESSSMTSAALSTTPAPTISEPAPDSDQDKEKEEPILEYPTSQPLDIPPPESPLKPSNYQPERAKPSGYMDAFTEQLRELWMVWLGGLCVALAGIFLVRYSIEAGLLGPTARIVLAIITGIGLHALAEWLRRNLAAHPSFAALAGGASITLYAAFLAALDLYHLISPLVAFFAMAAVALATISLAILHGPLLAIIGILGGYAVPILVSDGSGSIVIAMVYALIISYAALLLMTRIYRPWLWQGMVFGAMCWWLISLMEGDADNFRGIYLAILAYGLLAIPKFDFLLRRRTDSNLPLGSLIAILVACALSLLGEGLEPLSLMRWLPLTLIVLWVATQQSQLSKLPWCMLALQAGALILLSFGIDSPSDYLYKIDIDPPSNSTILIFAAVMASVYSGAAYLAVRAGQKSALWYSLGFLSPILWLAYCYLQITDMSTSLSWGGISLLIGLGYLILAGSEKVRSEPDALIWLTFSGHAAIALALVISLRDASLTLGIAAQLVSLTWLIKRFEITELDWLVKLVLTAIIVRLTLNPWIATYSADTHWSLWTYGGSTLLTALACYQIKTNQVLRGWLEAASIHLFILTVAMETRYWLYDGAIFSGNYDLVEAAINTNLWGALSLCYLYRAQFAESLQKWYLAMANVLLGITIINYLISLTGLNPWFGADPISSTPIFNILIPAYGLPVILALLFMKYHQRRLLYYSAWMAGFGGFAFVTMEIRHLWQGSLNSYSPASSGELYTYSIVWLVAAVVLVLGSTAKNKPNLYKASMGFLGLVIAKIFLIDMSDLEGLLRVASFMGLGLTLLGLAFLHKRLDGDLELQEEGAQKKRL